MSDFRLKAFYSVGEELEFHQASQELFVSQPAVTKHVRELESLYQVRLFDRLGNKISLTEAGRFCWSIANASCRNTGSWSLTCIY